MDIFHKEGSTKISGLIDGGKGEGKGKERGRGLPGLKGTKTISECKSTE